jgi:hypothetical protein
MAGVREGNTECQEGWMKSQTEGTLVIDLDCPICRLYLDGQETIVEHLVEEHGIGKRDAGLFARKVREWRLNRDEVAARMSEMLARRNGH